MSDPAASGVEMVDGTPEVLQAAGTGACLVLHTGAPVEVVAPTIDRVVGWVRQPRDDRDSWPGCYGAVSLPGQSMIHLECDEARVDRIADVCIRLQREAAAAGIAGVIEGGAAAEHGEPLPSRAVTVEALITEETSLPRRLRSSREPTWSHAPEWIEAGARWFDGVHGPAACCFDGWWSAVPPGQLSEIVRQNAATTLQASYWANAGDGALRTLYIPDPSMGPLQIGVGSDEVSADQVDDFVSGLVELVVALEPQPGYAAVAIGEQWPVAMVTPTRYRGGGWPVPREGATVLDAHHWQWLSHLMTEMLGDRSSAGPVSGERQIVVCGTPQDWLDDPGGASASANATLRPIIYAPPNR
jgi:hypothetical protein